MDNVTISRDSIKFGMINFGVERQEAFDSLQYIVSDIRDIKGRYLRLGYHLCEFEHWQYYHDFGYSSLAEFCDANLGLDKSLVSRCMKVFTEFSLVQNGNRTMFIDKRYEDYSYNQLCEMLPLPSDKRLLVSPDMTIKQIRELKKSLKHNTVEDNALVDSDYLELQLLDENGVPAWRYLRSLQPG